MTDQTASNVIPLPLAAQDWLAPPRAAAFTGLAGEITRAIEPHTESDPLAILAQLLVCFGSVIGRGAHYAVEATEHHGNEFALLVGPSAKARKGSSWDHVQRIFAEVDPGWASERIVSGLSSGEGLIWSVRDPDSDGRARGRGVTTKARPTSGCWCSRRSLLRSSRWSLATATRCRQWCAVLGMESRCRH